MVTSTYSVWKDEQIGPPPAKRVVIFKYPGLEKVLLSFSIDLAMAGSSRTYLDPSKPIVINGKIAGIPDLPSDSTKLRVIERSDIDVTPLIKNSPSGTDNQIEVNYIVGDKGLFRRKIGSLTMSLKVVTPEPKVERLIRYCFFCGAQNEIGAKQCIRCGRLQEIGGEETTICANCKATIPLRPDVKFCDKCGALQEERAVVKGMKKCSNCDVMIQSDAKFCSNCGAKQ
jgi:RNA polymerase subunit RPABC4/transcription elongation factor Spt4